MNNKQVLVSVIIPTYNHAQFISKAIESVMIQTYKNIEIIVVDNYSEDSTKEEVRVFQNNKIKYFRFRNNGIIAASRNFGVKKSNGDVIAFLDSDDEWNKEKVETQITHLFDDNISCVASNFAPIGNVDLWRNHIKIKDGVKYQDYSFNDIIQQNPVVNSSVMMLKKTFEKLEGLDEDSTYLAIEDWDLWIRASRIGEIRIINRILVNYRIHEDNTRDKRDVHLRSLKIFEKYKALGFLDDKLLTVALGSRYLLLGKACLDANDTRGVNYYKKALIYSKGFHNKIRAIIGILIFLSPMGLRQKIVTLLQQLSYVIQKKIYYKW
jgi:glycosyltransferase involved in cell wall biosynthesis